MNETELLRATLAALKEAGVLRASVKHEGLELAVEFAPELPVVPEMGQAPKPGGWKTLEALDQPFDLSPDGNQ